MSLFSNIIFILQIYICVIIAKMIIVQMLVLSYKYFNYLRKSNNIIQYIMQNVRNEYEVRS